MANKREDLVGFIWNIANKLRGPYRPPQYRRVMLPMTVLRRMDSVLAPTKEKVLEQFEKLKAQGHSDEAITKILGRTADPDRAQPLYNTSKFDFQKLLGDPDNIARNLITYINSFSPKAKEIFDKFKFEQEIEKLDNANRLYLIIKEFADLDLHPDKVDNIAMGYVFEELVRKFNEQANEEAGDHFTPREIIRLMAHLVYTFDEDVYKAGIARTIYDPTCGTGGMLSVSEEYVKEQNQQANLLLYGQEYNEESYAICCADLLIKDEPVDNIIFGDTLGDGKSGDGHAEKKFHYMLANPPFGVEWKTQQTVVEKEHATLGESGRFGAGLPRINDGSLLFLMHMISKMHAAPENGGEGSKIAIVFNGSPLFTGDAGSGESNIRRWIIENDWLDAVVALPDQMFYNTGIFTYIWLVSNRKRPERKGKVQLIDATKHFKKMRKSLGNKRNELIGEDEGKKINDKDNHIKEITRLYGDFKDDDISKFNSNGELKEAVASKVFKNQDFGYLKITVERPLQLNFQASPERIERLHTETAFKNLATSQKRKDEKAIKAEQAEGERRQAEIIAILNTLDAAKLYKNRDQFENALNTAFIKAGADKLEAPLKKAILNALSERDDTADVCTDSKSRPESDSELRDTELVPLPDNIALPLPIGYDSKADNNKLLGLVKYHCEDYLKREVLPHVKDAWIDHSKTKVGYEIPLNRHFYVYQAPRSLDVIASDIKSLESEIITLLAKVTA
jgi:type I restriction enzyme M protein